MLIFLSDTRALFPSAKTETIAEDLQMCPQSFGREDTSGNPGHLFTFGSPVMATLSVISAKKAHERVKSGSALLVCAYDSDEKFNNAQLDGAISLNQFKVQAQAGNVSKDKEIIFY